MALLARLSKHTSVEPLVTVWFIVPLQRLPTDRAVTIMELLHPWNPWQVRLTKIEILFLPSRL